MRILDTLDALAAVGALVVILILLATGRVPRDLELWAYGLGGALREAIETATTVAGRRRYKAVGLVRYAAWGLNHQRYAVG